MNRLNSNFNIHTRRILQGHELGKNLFKYDKGENKY